jgi:hypothetical protein
VDSDRAEWSADFDWYRANYQRLSFNDLKRINAIWLQKYPVQRHYNVNFVIDSFRRIVSEIGRDKLRIAELGGYNGNLALQVLRVFPRLHWLNTEIIKNRYGGSHLLMMGREEVKGLLSGSYAIMAEEYQIISDLLYRKIARLGRGAMHSVVKRFSPLLWHLPISRKWNTLWKARG